MSEPSVHEANKVLRVLNGEKLKFTVRLHKADGSIVEWQANQKPVVKWEESARGLWVMSAAYDGNTIMPWPEGALLLSEENPK